MVDHFMSASVPTKKARRTSEGGNPNAFAALTQFEPSSAQ